MNRIFFAIILIMCSSLLSRAQQTNCISGIHLGLVYPLSTNGVKAARYANTVSVHGLVGVSYAEHACTVSGIANIVHHNADGFAGAGIANVIGGSTTGVQCAGIINVTGGSAEGCQAAGIANLIKSNAEGCQLAGIMNSTHENVEGCQAAGILNTAKDVGGAQIAGIANNARNVEGIQAAGLVNKARTATAQAAGLINITGGTTDIQAAGLINIGHTVKGTQIAGLINIATDCNYPIGLINIIKHGEKAIGYTIDDKGTQLISFRSGSRNTYGILGIGGNYRNGQWLNALEGGLGLHMPLAFFFRLNLELTYLTLTDFQHGSYQQSSVRLFPSFKTGRHMEVFAGPAFSFVSSDKTLLNAPDNKYVWSENRINQVHGLNIGVIGGLQWYF